LIQALVPYSKLIETVGIIGIEHIRQGLNQQLPLFCEGDLQQTCRPAWIVTARESSSHIYTLLPALSMSQERGEYDIFFGEPASKVMCRTWFVLYSVCVEATKL
jgi:hypothetical protein